jgi:hypothetical protein
MPIRGFADPALLEIPFAGTGAWRHHHGDESTGASDV